MIFDGINTQETAHRGLVAQAAMQTEMVVEDNEFGQSLLQFFNSNTSQTF